MKNYSEPYKGQLRSYMVNVPEIIRRAPGLFIFGKRIKSLIFSTDVAIIRNMDADAVLAVYPFTPQPIITQCILNAADVPVFTGVGGGLTKGERVVKLAIDAEFSGAMGIVVNSPTDNALITEMSEMLDIPVVVTVVSRDEDIRARVEAGADIFNVSGALNTPDIVKRIKDAYPKMPVMATGGPTEESIISTIEAGADAALLWPAIARGLRTNNLSCFIVLRGV